MRLGVSRLPHPFCIILLALRALHLLFIRSLLQLAPTDMLWRRTWMKRRVMATRIKTVDITAS
jgi:hypothetical protein